MKRRLEFDYSTGKKPLVPTEAGKMFIERSRKILMEVDQLKSLVKEETDVVEGEFRLAIIPTLAPYLLPRFLPNFLKKLSENKVDYSRITDQSNNGSPRKWFVRYRFVGYAIG